MTHQLTGMVSALIGHKHDPRIFSVWKKCEQLQKLHRIWLHGRLGPVMDGLSYKDDDISG